MMSDGKYIERFKKDLGYFGIKKFRYLSNEIIYFYEKNHNIDLASFISFASNNELIADDVNDILRKVNLLELNMNDFIDFINVCEQEAKKQEIKDFCAQIE